MDNRLYRGRHGARHGGRRGDGRRRRIAPRVGERRLSALRPRQCFDLRQRSDGDPHLPEHSVDIVFFCDVLHHIENRAAYYPKLAKALKPGGRIVVIDFYKKDLPIGPPPSMKLSDAEVIAELGNAGFTLASRLDILPYQYYLFFDKR
jgi:predicted methyltransferase